MMSNDRSTLFFKYRNFARHLRKLGKEIPVREGILDSDSSSTAQRALILLIT